MNFKVGQSVHFRAWYLVLISATTCTIVHLVADIRNKYNATRILKAVMARVTG